MPWFKGFRATNIRKAFILNALAAALVSSVAVIVKDRLDAKTKLGYMDKYKIVLVVTFIASLFVYYALFILFGFGGGMLVN